MLTPGSLVGDPSRRYQIVRAVGRGGMGEVYEAIQVALGRRVALKTIREDLSERAELLARFRREAESAAALGHPNLVQVTDFQQNPGEPPFLVMEMLDGTTLKGVLEESGRLEPARAAFIGVQLLSGLAAAHRAGIIHRDVKPGNIFLQSTTAMRDLVKVLDFGVAKLAIESAPPGAAAMTRVGEVLGTLSYMAPEQGAIGGPIDGRTDVYAVGATLFHALAGLRPFEATEPGGVRAPLSRIAPWVHRDLAAVVERALERAPEARWPSADAMAAALQRFASAAAPAPPAGSSAKGDTAPAGGGWDPSAIGRLEAPTGGSTFGRSSSQPPAGHTTFDPRQALGNAPTAYADASVAAPPYAAAPAAAPPMVSSAAPIGAVPYHMPSAPPMAMPLQPMRPMRPMP
ncbi:MAG TPA: serine/threonine-protein kinase, partial [Labilithrix sp.]|nr:serine/threonine-protein kinase [Labilithrix sp.]